MIADTPEDFANAILLCASDEELCYRIGENAHQLALEKYDIKKVSSSLIDFFQRCNYTKANAAKSSFKDSL